ncbi:MAG: NADH-quinone oxidoreductase subunit B [Chloroflexi bacterium]|nr:NADH-quinone oxidoreductase subunit B [Chloroflexota bacterium]
MADQIIQPQEIPVSTGDPASKSGQPGVVFAKLDDVVRWARTGSMWPLLFGLACCAIEMMAVYMPRFDLARFGMEVYRASPRQADLMFVAGRVSRKMAPVVRQLYDQMLEPKWVIAMGDCAACGGIYNNYAILQGVDEIIPVDVYVAGCPPRPEALMDGILKLHDKVKNGAPKGQIRITDWGLRG